MPHRVVQIGEVRDLLSSWDAVRQKIVTGGIKSFALTVQDLHGAEATYLGGRYKVDPDTALRAFLRQSCAMTKATEDAADNDSEVDEVPPLRRVNDKKGKT